MGGFQEALSNQFDKPAAKKIITQVMRDKTLPIDTAYDLAMVMGVLLCDVAGVDLEELFKTYKASIKKPNDKKTLTSLLMLGQALEKT